MSFERLGVNAWNQAKAVIDHDGLDNLQTTRRHFFTNTDRASPLSFGRRLVLMENRHENPAGDRITGQFTRVEEQIAARVWEHR